MKDTEFIELLNLYVDHEIGVEDAKRLEAEVRRSPERFRTYREYCQMQKACAVLSAQHVGAASDGKAVAFEPASRTRGFGVYASGVCAAAACVALAVVLSKGDGSLTSAPQKSDTTSVATVRIEVPSAARALLRDVPSMVSLSPRSLELKSVLATQPLALTSEQRGADSTTVADERFAWMNRAEFATLPRVNADTLLFEAKAAEPFDGRTFGGRRSSEWPVEKAAFQFQR